MSWWWGLVFSFGGVLVGGVIGMVILIVVADRHGSWRE